MAPIPGEPRGGLGSGVGGLRRRVVHGEGQAVQPRPDASPEPSPHLRPPAPRTQASKCSVYLAWLFCGWAGLHHLLLQRDTHAVLWVTTFDGFGFGLLRDLWRIPSYVDEYNAEYYHMVLLRASAHRGRPWSCMRLVGQYIVGRWYGTVLSCVPPDSWSLALIASELVPVELRDVLDIQILAGLVGMSIGVWLVGSLGEYVQGGHFAFVLIGALCGQLLRVGLIPGMEMAPLEENEAASLGGYNMLGAMLGFYFASSWHPALHSYDVPGAGTKPRPAGRGLCTRFIIVLGCATFFWALAGYGAYDKGSITVTDEATGEPQTIKIKEVVANVLASPAVQQFTAAVGHLYSHMLEHGLDETLKLLKQLLDFDGESSAYDVLGLEPGATASEIKKAYHQLSKEHHPDKNPQDPEGAAEKMATINNAYEKLNEIGKRRKRTHERGKEDGETGDNNRRSTPKGKGKGSAKSRTRSSRSSG